MLSQAFQRVNKHIKAPLSDRGLMLRPFFPVRSAQEAGCTILGGLGSLSPRSLTTRNPMSGFTLASNEGIVLSILLVGIGGEMAV